MCNIWKNEAVDEMEPAHYLKLPKTLRTINVTGGEPFLRKDLVEVVQNIHSRAPSSRIVFSTNGFLTDRIMSAVREIREFHEDIGVGVSIDGIGAAHDRIRGVEGAYKKATATVEGLRTMDLGDLRIGMTLMAQNAADAASVYRLSRQLGVQFTVTFAHNSEIYFQKTDNRPPELAAVECGSLGDVLRAQLLSRSVKDWFRAYHIKGIMDPALRHEFVSRCEAGARYFFMSPSGDVYPCMVMNMPIGNLRKAGSWDELFMGDVDEKVLKSVKECKEDCWMVCNTRSLIKAHPFRAGGWVAANKIRAHVRKRSVH